MLQLLKDYRAYHSAFGGALPLDETGVVDASYGPAGMVEAGMEYRKGERARLAASYRHLENALTMLKSGGPVRSAAYLVLLEPYLGDPADPSVVARWRENPKDCRTQWHDLAIEELAGYLRNKELYVAWPKRMTGQQEKEIDRRNDEFYRLYRTLRDEKQNKTNAVKNAAAITGYTERRGWQIVQAREGRQSA